MTLLFCVYKINHWIAGDILRHIPFAMLNRWNKSIKLITFRHSFRPFSNLKVLEIIFNQSTKQTIQFAFTFLTSVGVEKKQKNEKRICTWNRIRCWSSIVKILFSFGSTRFRFDGREKKILNFANWKTRQERNKRRYILNSTHFTLNKFDFQHIQWKKKNIKRENSQLWCQDLPF